MMMRQPLVAELSAPETSRNIRLMAVEELFSNYEFVCAESVFGGAPKGDSLRILPSFLNLVNLLWTLLCDSSRHASVVE